MMQQLEFVFRDTIHSELPGFFTYWAESHNLRESPSAYNPFPTHPVVVLSPNAQRNRLLFQSFRAYCNYNHISASRVVTDHQVLFPEFGVHFIYNEMPTRGLCACYLVHPLGMDLGPFWPMLH